MSGLEFVACRECETVSAVPAETATCPRCGATTPDPVAPGRGAAAYFAGAMDPD